MILTEDETEFIRRCIKTYGAGGTSPQVALDVGCLCGMVQRLAGAKVPRGTVQREEARELIAQAERDCDSANGEVGMYEVVEHAIARLMQQRDVRVAKMEATLRTLLRVAQMKKEPDEAGLIPMLEESLS